MAETERVGVDTGGTFTDFVIIRADGRMDVRKRSSSPRAPSESVTEGVAAALADGDLTKGFALVHGTTVATNALLERRGAPTALLMTAGFRDVLEIGRQARENLYALHPIKPVPLIPREHRFEIVERLDWQGRVLTPLDEAQATRVLDAIQALGLESVAICFLFSYLNPAHEQRVGKMARARGLDVSLSCEIAPEPREYERAATTAANAFVAPKMARYLRELEARLHEQGASSLRVMQSDGGALAPEEAGRRAIKTALSGPAGGVIAAIQAGASAGVRHLLTFDMGGTSTDVALIVDGHCPTVTTGSLAGMPLRTPLLDIHTVGAGGGSLAWLDRGGSLRVGPQSAGADPGPVAYGRGEQLTVTDANLLLGRLPADALLAGSVPLDAARVRATFNVFASQLNVTPEQAALGILSVANAAMARALRHVSVERGHDPADFTLLSFGGAGGLHACALADALGMRAVLIPRFPGAFSALGLALADVKREYARALPITGPLTPGLHETLTARFAGLETEAARAMEADGFTPAQWQAQRLLDLRYAGQSFDLRVPVNGSEYSAALDAFHRLHHARYGHADAREPVEAVAVRLIAVAPSTLPRLAPPLPSTSGLPHGERTVCFTSGWQSTSLYDRAELTANQRIVGPAILVQTDATTLLESGWQATVETDGSLRLTHI